MMYRVVQIFFYLVFLLAPRFLLADSQLFKTKIIPSENIKALKGVPADITIQITNVSGVEQILVFEGIWYMNGKICGDGPGGDIGPADPGTVIVAPPKVAKDWSKQYHYDLATYCGLKTAGKYELEYQIPSGFYETSPIDSIVVNVTINEPDEVEQQVYDWLQECYSNLKSVSLSSCYKDLLTNYPHSIYTAWIIFPALAEPENYQPEIAKQLVETSYYPSGNSVPDEEFGFRDIAEGGSMAKWQINWAEKILIDHPDFPYRERLQLVIALNKLTLNDEKAGMDLLASISQNDTEIGRWCKKFLSLK